MSNKVHVRKTFPNGNVNSGLKEYNIGWRQLKDSYRVRGGQFEDQGASFTYMSTLGTFHVFTNLDIP